MLNISSKQTADEPKKEYDKMGNNGKTMAVL